MSLTLTNTAGQVITVPPSPILELGNQVTLTAWVNIKTPAPANQVLTGKPALATHLTPFWDYSIHLIDTGGGLGGRRPRMYITRSTGAITTATGPSDLVPGAWTFIVGTYDGLNARIYVDGTLRNTSGAAPGTLRNGNQRFLIGANADGLEILRGDIADCRIFNRALDDKEILTLYSALGSDGDVFGSIARFGLKEGGIATNPTTVYDVGPNAFAGAVSGSIPFSEDTLRGLRSRPNISVGRR